ncbi:transcription factor E2F6 isoform X2 [Ictalurus furcatus]|uniref:transcription factor E2F6 isoform X2 n=1 Tax=Ictalurus furcatus TaxID=66913 RepID=UPI0023504DBE|nr:transcription factor E2F6 isoform X2 [Ictalurus furcatus]
MVKCVVRGCQNQSDLKPGEMRNRPRKRFFSFPADQGRVRVWMAALRESVRFSAEHKICEDHFLPEHITPGGISSDAIPIMPPLEGGILGSGGWISPVEPSDELTDQIEVTEIPADDDVEDDDEQDDDEDDDDDDEDEEDEDDEECEDSDYTEEEPLNIDEEAEKEWLERLQENLKNATGKKRVRAKYGATPRSEVTLGRLTKRFMDLLHAAPEGILDLNEATEKLGTRKRRVYDITNVLNGIKLIAKKSKSKIQWVGPSPISCFKGQWKGKMKSDLLNLKTMEESLDWLIKDCAQQLFALTDLTENANSAYVTYDDVCRIAAFQDQTVIAIRAPEETKLEVPTPTEDCIKIHLKGSRGPIHVLTCETNGSDTTTQSEQLRTGRFLTLEESRIETTPLLADLPTVSPAVRSA